MPELPDIEVYAEALRKRVRGSVLERVRLANPFLLRTFEVPISEAQGRRVLDVRRMVKRLVFALEGESGAPPSRGSSASRPSTSRRGRSSSPRQGRSGGRRCTS